LQGAKLKGAILISACLKNAKLRRADLTQANLRGAALTGAHLHGADLTKSNLRGADMDSVKLAGANLTEADLRGVKHLRPSDLRRAKLNKTKGLAMIYLLGIASGLGALLVRLVGGFLNIIYDLLSPANNST
jgi:uncharacterized protein YjbI with pentapeptide repeats